jgi:hypothetical protein
MRYSNKGKLYHTYKPYKPQIAFTSSQFGSARTTLSQPNPYQKKSNLLKFFLNEIPLISPGDKEDKIDQILKNWEGDFNVLENHCGYIQWLFPNKERGVNSYAPIITNEDIKLIQICPEIQKRFLSGFDMMLDFYGFRRNNYHFSPNSQHILRIHHLRSNPQNYLRITRILHALHLFGYDELQFRFLLTLLELVYFERKPLANADYSAVIYWIKTMKKNDQIRIIQELESKRIPRGELWSLQKRLTPENYAS